MIKALIRSKDGTGKKIIFLGITQDNVDRLQEGKPINVNLKDLGIESEIIICYGYDIKDLKKQLEPMIRPETKFSIGGSVGSFVESNKG